MTLIRSRFSLGLVGLFALATVVGCSQNVAGASSSDESALATTPPASTVVQLRELVHQGFVVFDDMTAFPSSAITLDSQTTTNLGVTNVNQLLRIHDGAVFNVLSVDGSVGSDGPNDSTFSDVRHFLVLDPAGIAHLAQHGRKTAVHGDRLDQLKEVFARTPSANDPSSPKWGDNPFFTWPSGVEAVAFIGMVYVHQADGAIVKFSLDSDGFDPLDQ
jgi:hypothetical protein